MGYSCGCQLSRNLNDYVYAQVNTKINCEFEPNTILIFPKKDFHWDSGLWFLKDILPDTIFEVCEGFFEYEESVDIKETMKELGIGYSQNLYDVWHDIKDKNCLCDDCIHPENFPKLEFVEDNNIEKCPNGYRHIVKN